jgi:hypothetical protein
MPNRRRVIRPPFPMIWNYTDDLKAGRGYFRFASFAPMIFSTFASAV